MGEDEVDDPVVIWENFLLILSFCCQQKKRLYVHQSIHCFDAVCKMLFLHN